MKRFMNVLFAMLITFCIAGGAHAIPLSDLFNGGSISAGDKLFDNWSLTSYTASDPARSFNAANINVTALNDGGMNPGPGLNFSVLNNELSVSGDGVYAFIDLMFGFRVLPSAGNLINGASLSFGFAALSNPNGLQDLGDYIHEDIGKTPGAFDLATMAAEFSYPSSTAGLNDSAGFAGNPEVYVTKNILVWAADVNDTAALYSFEQRFSQTPAVPEPSTLFLLGGGLAGLAVLRKKMGGRAK